MAKNACVAEAELSEAVAAAQRRVDRIAAGAQGHRQQRVAVPRLDRLTGDVALTLESEVAEEGAGLFATRAQRERVAASAEVHRQRVRGGAGGGDASSYLAASLLPMQAIAPRSVHMQRWASPAARARASG